MIYTKTKLDKRVIRGRQSFIFEFIIRREGVSECVYVYVLRNKIVSETSLSEFMGRLVGYTGTYECIMDDCQKKEKKKKKEM